MYGYTSLKKCISQECQGASIRVTNTTQYYQYKFQQISCLYMIEEKIWYSNNLLQIKSVLPELGSDG